MVDTEVQNILGEIRERVRAEADARSGPEESAHLPGERHGEDEMKTALAHLETCRTVAGRAAGALPPLTTKREGLAARLELWLKRRIGRATHWYVWEQTNFNQTMKGALDEITRLLQNHQQELAHLRHQLAAASHLKERLAAPLASLESRLAALESSFAVPPCGDSSATLEEVRALQTEMTRLRAALDEGLSRLREEQRGHTEQLLDEQRVTFKQLALEINETATNAERARRIAQAQLDELKHRLQNLGTPAE